MVATLKRTLAGPGRTRRPIASAVALKNEPE
jgi:hypothetical protein